MLDNNINALKIKKCLEPSRNILYRKNEKNIRLY